MRQVDRSSLSKETKTEAYVCQIKMGLCIAADLQQRAFRSEIELTQLTDRCDIVKEKLDESYYLAHDIEAV